MEVWGYGYWGMEVWVLGMEAWVLGMEVWVLGMEVWVLGYGYWGIRVLGYRGMGIGVWRYGYMEVWVLGYGGMGIGIWRYGYWDIKLWVLGHGYWGISSPQHGEKGVLVQIPSTSCFHTTCGDPNLMGHMHHVLNPLVLNHTHDFPLPPSPLSIDVGVGQGALSHWRYKVHGYVTQTSIVQECLETLQEVIQHTLWMQDGERNHGVHVCLQVIH